MLTISDLCLSYGSQKVLDGFNLMLQSGTICVLKGPNGSGKSSLLEAISGVIPEYLKASITGSICWFDIDLPSLPLREKFHYLWHALCDAESQFFFPTIEAELAFALENKGLPPAEIRSRINQAAGYFGFEKSLLQAPNTLSGGQKKLLLCAIAHALNPPLLLMDEPVNGLSENAEKLFCAWLKELKQNGTTVLVAEHNPSVIALADLVIAL